MIRIGFVLLVMMVISCKNSNTQAGEEDESGAFSFSAFSERFSEAELPYQLADTSLLNNKDTATIKNPNFLAFIPDSIKKKMVGNASKVSYVPLVKLKGNKKEHFFILKATSGSKKAALLVVFDENKNYSASFPFLIPDNDSKTQQVSFIDKSFAVTRMQTRKRTDDLIAEGRDVYSYDPASKSFMLIMTDILDDSKLEIINPIDTFSMNHRYAGDYVKDKRNIVSIRAGHSENEIQFFIHFERMNGECNGELKGTAFLTSSKTAVYRQSGDPCVLEMHFTSNSVRLKEVEGCGSYRGIQCVIEGSFPKKKQTAGKTTEQVK